MTTAETARDVFSVERNGINVIAEAERGGNPRDLFWPWAAANISLFGLSYGSFLLGFGVGFWQALLAGAVGTVASFLLVGFVSLAGKRGSAPTMVLSRAAFGVRGNALPAAVSYLLLVGWETVLVALATLATATVFGRLGWADGTVTRVAAFVVVAAVIVLAGTFGFELIMRLQAFLTIAVAALTVGFVLLTIDEIDWSTVAALPGGSATAVLGALVLAMTGFGIGWVNTGADYSRYLPRRASSGAVVAWTTIGASFAPLALVAYGLLLAGSKAQLNAGIAADPIGALTGVIPTWYLVPFALVAVGGLIGGAVLDIYSSGLALLTLGVRIPRWAAAALDGVLMIVGASYVVFVAEDFLGPFQGFLITLGVPITAWCGVFLADLVLRDAPYADAELYDPRGRYGSVDGGSLATLVLATLLGWGLVVNGLSPAFAWLGYLLDPLGLGPKLDGPWTYANLGVLVAFVVGFLGRLLLGTSRVRAQEAVPSG